MILVTVGMHARSFNRLIEEMDSIALQIDEEVVMQIGATPYEPRAARWFTFTTQEKMEELCQQARVIVSHAGAGSILIALRHRKPLIVVPRRQMYDEHIDDHQLELADELSEAGALLVVYAVKELRSKLADADNFKPQVVLPDRRCLVNAVRQAVLSGGNGEI